MVVSRTRDALALAAAALLAAFPAISRAGGVAGLPAISSQPWQLSAKGAEREKATPPSFADVPYGDHVRQKVDIWLARSNKPAPLIFYIHGGGWAAQDKRDIHDHLDVRAFLDAGISVASVNYRLLQDANAAGVKPPVQWPLDDARRALQFVRSKAGAWNLDKTRIASSGVSAGGASALWLAMHDEMAEPRSPDPVARESTRLFCVAVKAPVVSLDPRQVREWIPNAIFGAHAFGFANLSRADSFAPFLAARESFLPDIRRYSPIDQASADDPPVFIEFPMQDKPPVPGDPQTDPSHSAISGLMLERKLKALGVPVELRYRGDGKTGDADAQEYLTRMLSRAPDGKEGAVIHGTSILGLWLMGQSLCEGAEALPLVTPEDSGWGNYAFKRGVRTWIQGDHSSAPEQRPNSQFAFAPLTAAVFGGLGETIANGLADHLKATLPGMNAKRAKTAAPHYLVAYAGQGGRTIEELSIADESTDPRTPAVKHGEGGFYKTSLDDARRSAEEAKAQGADFKIAALIWMQGEANGGPTGGIVPSRWKEELPFPAGQEWYRDRLVAYRKQWSDDLRAITGQPSEIPMFTYQTLGAAGEAQLMAADADPHIVMVGPHYMVPSAINSRRADSYGSAIHLSADGQRWYGEQIAKVIRRVTEGERWQPLRPRKAWIDASRRSILIDFIVPRPPLVLDESFLPREQSEMAGGYSSLCGFRIRNGTAAVPALTAVELESPTRLRIRLASPLPAGSDFVLSYGLAYAGKIGTITSVRERPESGKHPMTEALIAGKLEDRLAPLLSEGAFYMANTVAGSAFAEAPARLVYQDHGSTVLPFENRERRNSVDFTAGQTLIALRPFAYGNLRDSDPEASIYEFADKAYGTRAGQRYPLWNWCVQFSNFPIADGERKSE
jgi:acetyl esterase/lipase